jgi:hypothetical protein
VEGARSVVCDRPLLAGNERPLDLVLCGTSGRVAVPAPVGLKGLVLRHEHLAG